MADIPMSWSLGIDNVSQETSIPRGGVADCVNADIGRGGTLSRRAGYSLLVPGNAHSLWASAAGISLCVVSGVLNVISYKGSVSLQPVRSLLSNAPLAYEDMNGEVVFCNRDEVGVVRVAADGSISSRPIAPDDPSAPAVAESIGIGGLSAGTYGALVTFLSGNEESAASAAIFTTISHGNGLSVTVPTPSDPEVTAVRIYRTATDGDVFYLAADVPVGFPSPYRLGAAVLGRQADTRFLQRIPGGQIVRHWNGRLLIARGRNLLFSEPMRYGLYSSTTGFVQLPERIRIMQPVDGGVYVGTRSGVFFLSGQSPDEWQLVDTRGEPPVEGSGYRLPSGQLADSPFGGSVAALWLSGNGFVIGSPDGNLIEPQSKRIGLPSEQVAAGVGATVVHDRRVLTCIT